jgi:hypothetical protein
VGTVGTCTGINDFGKKGKRLALRGMQFGKHATCSNTANYSMIMHLLTYLQCEMMFPDRAYITDKILQDEARLKLHILIT